MRIISLFALGVSCVLLVGCSFFGGIIEGNQISENVGAEVSSNATSPTPSVKINNTEIDNAEIKQPAVVTQKSPIELEIMQAYVSSNNSLEIVADVRALTEIDARRVAIVASGFSRGVLKQEQVQKLSDIFGKDVVPEGEKILVRFSLYSSDLTDYQVRASWGAEADSVFAKQGRDLQQDDDVLRAQLNSRMSDESVTEVTPTKVVPTNIAQDATVQDVDKKAPKDKEPINGDAILVEIVNIDKVPTNCANNSCDILMSVNTRIRNDGVGKINSVTLGIGLFWANEGQTPVFPNDGDVAVDNEELVNLKDLSIAQGENRLVRVRIDQPVPQVPGGAFIPHIRLVSYVKE